MNLRLIFLQIVNGFITGSMYAIFATGLTLIWGTMKLLNFAHGEFFMLGGYFLYFSAELLGFPPIIAIIITIFGVFIFGLIIEKIIISKLLEKPNYSMSTIIATLGISVFLQNFALKVWGERYLNVPYYIEGVVKIFTVPIAYQRLLILIASFTTIFLLWFLLKKTRFGLALRATAQDRDSAMLYGIDFHRVYFITFGISGALIALSATMLAPIFLINPLMGLPILLKAFVVAVLGGLGSVEGAILAGFVLGISESLIVTIFSSEWKDVFSFLILILVLSIKPSGFFGQKEW